MKKNLIFASRGHQNLPFTLGGLTFFSLRLDGEEELLMAEVSEGTLDTNSRIGKQVDAVVQLLKRRAQGDGAHSVDHDWAMLWLGPSNTIGLLQFFRTGQRPAEFLGDGVTFDLPVWGDPIVLGDEGSERTFESRAAGFSEQIALVNAQATDTDTVGTVQRLRTFADIAAAWLSARMEGPPVDGAWLLGQLQLSEITQVLNYLVDGSVPEDEDPNAGDAAATPIPA